MKKFTFILAFLCIGYNLSAQPYFDWGRNLGGSDYDVSNSITYDNKGNVYTTGAFSGTADFDPGAGSYNLTSAGSLDVFVSKVDASGNFVWARQFAGTDDQQGTSLAVDSKGNVFITGYFQGTTDFNPTSGSFNLTTSGWSDIFICKLDKSGNFEWVKQMGGVTDDIAYSIKLDTNGNIYTTGEFQGTADFNPGVGTNNLTPSLFVGTFISKLNASGNYVWAKCFGGSSNHWGNSLKVDKKSSVYLTGYFDGNADFNPGSGTYSINSYGNQDVFICKLDSSGNFNWAKHIGGTSIDKGWGIALDNVGNVYTAGTYSSVADMDPGTGTYNVTAVGDFDIFVSKLDTAGNFVWGRSMGGNIDDIAYSVAADETGVYTTGNFNTKADFDPGAGTCFLNSPAGRDAFISKLDKNGNFAWAKQIGGTGADNLANCITVDKARNIYTTGYFTDSIDIDPTSSSNVLASAGSADIFVQKLSQCVPTSSNISVTACDSYESPSDHYTWTISGLYKDTIENKDGCDSIITIQLTINKKSTHTMSATACTVYTSPSGKYQWTVSNTYKDTIPNKAGCDSLLTINLTINNQSTSSTLTASACKSYTSPSGKYEWTTSNTYMDTIPNKVGCDSVITVQLTISGASTSGTLTVAACNGYTSPSGKYHWTSSNIYKDTIPNKAGCDSILTITLTVNTVDTSVTKLGTKLTANATGVRYQWIDCKNGNQPIAGDTNRIFTGVTGGSYAVIIKGSCTDTSSCHTITSSGINKRTISHSFTISPNPTSGIINLHSDYDLSGAVFTIFDMQGRIIMQKSNISGNEVLFDLTNQASGIYFIEKIQNQQISRLKLVKY